MRRTVPWKRVTLFLMLVCIAPVPLFSATTITYQEDATTDFPNPERGFYCQTDRLIRNFSTERLNKVRRDSNITLIRVYYLLDKYVNTDILPRAFLDTVLHDCDTLRLTGAKMIPRFIYARGGECRDAPLPRILLHINQIAPILRANADVVAYLEAGFIGMYGEWHYYNCSLQDINGLGNTDSRRKILFRLLDSLPGWMVALRYNFHKRAIFGTNTPLGPDSAFSGSHRARTGAINDAFASNANNMGSYQPTKPDSIEAQKVFLSRDNRYVPQGGEPESPEDSTTGRCDSALVDLRRMHWDVMNNGYNPRMHSLWRSGGCRSEIGRKLGYRIVLIDASLRDSVQPGSLFTGTLRLKNTGYGKLFNRRGCELIFRNTSTSLTFAVKLGVDPRRWCMTDSVVTVAINAPIPMSIQSGAYRVYLNLPDTAQRLYGKKEYSIRLANANLWEELTGFNSLLHSVYISPDVSINQQNAPLLSRGKILNIVKQGNSVSFTFNTVATTPFSLEIFTPAGLKIWSRTLSPGSTEAQKVMAPKLPPGMYLVKVTARENRPSGSVGPVEIRRFFN